MKKRPSYLFRMLSLAFWVVVVVGLSQVFGGKLGWFSSTIIILFLWLFTVAARDDGIKVIPKILKSAGLGFTQQLPFFLPALAIGFAFIVIGAYHSSRILVIIGLIINFLAVWVVNWPSVEWYGPLIKKIKRAKK